jgi:hypothetical protein
VNVIREVVMALASEARNNAIKAAEDKIRAILLLLDTELIGHGDTIAEVRVDTRSFAAMHVEIRIAALPISGRGEAG